MAGEQEEKREKNFLEGEKKKFKKPEDKPIEKISTIGINEDMLKRVKDKNSNSKTNNNLNFDQDFGDELKDSQKNPSETASSPATVTSTLAQPEEKKNQTSKEIQKHSNSTRPIPKPRENSNQERPVAQSAPSDKWTQWYKTIAQQARQENPQLENQEKLREKIQELVSRSISNRPKNKTYTDDQIQEFVGKIMQSVPPVIRPKPNPPLPSQDSKPKLSSTQSVEKPNSEGKKEQVVTDSTGQQVNKPVSLPPLKVNPALSEVSNLQSDRKPNSKGKMPPPKPERSYQKDQKNVQKPSTFASGNLLVSDDWDQYIKQAAETLGNKRLASNQEKLDAIFQDTQNYLNNPQYTDKMKSEVMSKIALKMEIPDHEIKKFLEEKESVRTPTQAQKTSIYDYQDFKPGSVKKGSIQNILERMSSISLPKFGRRSSSTNELREVDSSQDEAALAKAAESILGKNNVQRDSGSQKSERSLPKAVLNQAVGLFKKIVGHGKKEGDHDQEKENKKQSKLIAQEVAQKKGRTR